MSYLTWSVGSSQSWAWAAAAGNMGSSQSRILPSSSLGCILKTWSKFGGDYRTKGKIRQHCKQEWPQYKLDGGEQWPENGSFNYNTILQWMLFCLWEGKCYELMYVSAFIALYRDLRSQTECGSWEDHTMLRTEMNFQLCMNEEGWRPGWWPQCWEAVKDPWSSFPNC